MGTVEEDRMVVVGCSNGICGGAGMLKIPGDFSLRRKAIFRAPFLCLLISGIAAPARGQERETALKENVCYTENVVAQRGSSFPVGVFVSNADTLVGMQVPLYYKSDQVDLICDSVSFEKSRCRGFSVKFFKIEPAGKIVFFALLNMGDSPHEPPALYPGDGRVATLWFTAPPAAQAGQVRLGSGPGAYFPDEKINYGYLFWNPTAIQIECRFKAGNITLK